MAKLVRVMGLIVVLLALAALLAAVVIGCAQAKVAPETATPEPIGTPPASPSPQGPPRYTTRELPLREGASAAGMTLWEGKVIYTATEKDEKGGIIDSRIFQYDLETGQEKLLIKAQPGHNGPSLLHRSGDWLFYEESAIIEPRPAGSYHPCFYFAHNLRTGERRLLSRQKQWSCYGPYGPGYGSQYWGTRFVYIEIETDRSTGVSWDQIRVYDIETGQDSVLLQVEDGDTGLSDPALYEDKVLFSQAWRSDWPPGVTATAVPGRPGAGPRQQMTGDIFSLDLKTGEKVNLSNTGSAYDHAIWGDYLMWIDHPGGSQEHGSGEVCVLNMKTGELKTLTNDATYLHLYTSPRAGDGFFIWRDAHQVRTAVPVYFPESGEMVYLQGPEGKPHAVVGAAEGKALFWSWSDWSGVSTPMHQEQYELVEGRPWKVFMTVFE